MSGDHGPRKKNNRGFFWTDDEFEPKRTFRWKVEFDNLINHIPPQYIVSVKKPGITFETIESEDLRVKKYNPGQGRFTPVEIVCIDDEQNSVTSWIDYYLYLSNFNLVLNNENGTIYMSLDSKIAKEKTRNIEIKMLNEYGYAIEIWKLKGAWISAFAQSDLNYTDSGLATYTIIIVYDGYEYLVSNDANNDQNILYDTAQMTAQTQYSKSSKRKMREIHGGLSRRIESEKKNSIKINKATSGLASSQTFGSFTETTGSNSSQ